MNVKLINQTNASDDEYKILIDTILDSNNASKLNNGGVWKWQNVLAKTSKRKNNIKITIKNA